MENALAGHTIEYLALIQDDGVDLSMLPNRRFNLLESGAGHNRKGLRQGVKFLHEFARGRFIFRESGGNWFLKESRGVRHSRPCFFSRGWRSNFSNHARTDAQR